MSDKSLNVKKYVEDGTTVEATLVMFNVTDNGTKLINPVISDAGIFQVFDTERDDFRSVEWDHSVKPPRLYYVE